MSISIRDFPFIYPGHSTGYLQKVHYDTYAPNVTLLAVLMGIDNLWGCQVSRNKIILIIQ